MASISYNNCLLTCVVHARDTAHATLGSRKKQVAASAPIRSEDGVSALG
jgi:hypothetical protein